MNMGLSASHAVNRRSSNRNVFRWLGIYRSETEKSTGARLGGRFPKPIRPTRVAPGGNDRRLRAGHHADFPLPRRLTFYRNVIDE